jgi:hypothetical protein
MSQNVDRRLFAMELIDITNCNHLNSWIREQQLAKVLSTTKVTPMLTRSLGAGAANTFRVAGERIIGNDNDMPVAA